MQWGKTYYDPPIGVEMGISMNKYLKVFKKDGVNLAVECWYQVHPSEMDTMH